MYAFGGWNDMAFVASEMRNKRNIPRALLAGTTLITALYLAVNAAYIMALGWDGARQFETPLASVILGKQLGDFAGRAMAVLVMVSALGAINGLIFTGSRVYSSLGKDWGVFALLGRWHPKFGSPVWALLIQAVIAIGMIFAVGTETGRNTIDNGLSWIGSNVEWTGLGPLPWKKYFGGFNTLFAATAPVFWMFFLGTGISLFALRQQDRELPRPFSVPLFPLIPLIFCAACSYFLYRALDYAKTLSLIGWIPLAIGIPLYYLSSHRAVPESTETSPPTPEHAATQLLPAEPPKMEPATVDEFPMPQPPPGEVPAPASE
jgi:amino acid transporter